MNAQIKELAEQASLYAVSDNSSMVFDVWKKRYTEKFAELVVQECVEQIIEKGTDWIDWAPSQAGVRPEHSAMAQHIKKHFGIEK